MIAAPTATGPLDIEIRPERADDPAEVAAIARVVATAFGSPVEAELVGAIRASVNYLPVAALVAVHGDTVVGHVMISYVGSPARRANAASPACHRWPWPRRPAAWRRHRPGRPDRRRRRRLG